MNDHEQTDAEMAKAPLLNPRFVIDDAAGLAQTQARVDKDFNAFLQGIGPLFEEIGRVVRAYGSSVHVTGITARIGQRCTITTPGQVGELLADVVGITANHIILYPMGSLEGLSAKSEVRLVSIQRSVRFSESLVGCILDGAGQLLYQPTRLGDTVDVPLTRRSPNPLQRKPIDTIFSTGVAVIDTLLTVGEGQRMGIFAPAGGGKSTLLSMLAKHSEADVVVIGLIGERGREVLEFIENSLGSKGLEKSVLVVTTSDRPAIERVNAAHCATTIAEGFRSRGRRVLLLMDSLTRYARALREIGLSVGEPPVRQGFPPSVFSELPRLLERSGNDATSSITAFYTILEDDEASSDPVSEEVRSIVDGHIVLSRSLAEQGNYPPVDVLSSASRLIGDITDKDHYAAALRIRRLIAKYQEIELLLQLGEYQPGNDSEADEAVQKREQIRDLLVQASDHNASLDDSLRRLFEVSA